MAFYLSEKQILNAATKAICQEMRLQFVVVESFTPKRNALNVVQARITFMCLLVTFVAIRSKRKYDTQLVLAIRAVRLIHTTRTTIKFAVMTSSFHGTFKRLNPI